MAQQNNTYFGVLEPFDGGDFIDYSERLNAYFIANNIGQVAADANEAAKQAADKRKVAVTTSVMGKSTYSTLKDLCLPDLPAEKSYEEIITILKGFYKPKVLEVAETYRFHQAVQTESETVHCNFGTYLTRALRDQFVGGVRSRSTRKKLLSEDRTFDQAVKVAQADELAEKESKEMLLSAERTDTTQAHSISNKRKYHFKGGDANKAKPFEQGKTCFRCGSTQHLADKCSHTYTTCNYCKKAGHLAKVCFKKKKADSNAKAHNIVATHTDESSDSDSDMNSVNGTPVTIFMQNINSVGQKSEISPQYKLGVNINGQEVSMEIDTGSSVTLLNSGDFERMGGDTNVLKPSTVVLKSYTGNEIKCYGEDNMKVKVGEQVSDIKIRVVEGPSLLGRDIMTKFRLPWHNIFSIVPTTAEDIIQQYHELFDERRVGKLKGVQVSLRVNDDNPVFMKPRVVPFAIRKKYEEALEKLVQGDIIEKVEHSEWASPTVPMIKPDGNVRICGDYSGTNKQAATLEQYPVPTFEELLSNLSGGTKFTKLDLSQAYHPLELTLESRKYTTINTHHGLCQYKRLIFGVNSAVSIFQRTIENVLKGLPGCCVRIDDILVTGKTDEIHMENLHRVLQRLLESGLKLKREKFHFMLGEVIYLGMSISEAGISPTEEEVQAIKDAAPPANVSELQSFIGTANFLRVGAVLLQPGHDGALQPVAYASRTLNAAEKNYAQIERESLAIVFGVTKFRQYLLGRHFKLLTDHKPLITLLGEHKSVPQLASARIKRWSLLLAAYNYTIEFISGKENVYADFLSRKPINIQPTPEEQVEVRVMFIEGEQIVNSTMVAMETKKDPVLSNVLDFTKNGWPEKPQPELQLYHTRRLELSHEDGILLWDTRVAIPESLRDILLKDLHAEHFGIVKMKQLARKYLWWPKLDKEIEETVKSCMACQEEAKSPNASQQASWSWPGGPWKRIHIDYAGPYLGKMFLVVVDAYSKYLEIVPMSNATSTTTITALRHIFSNFGLLEHIVSDNGSQFTSEEFQKFLNDNNIQHTTTAPGHPATNGLAERYVGNFKDKLKKMGDTGKPLQTKLDRFLLTYRATPTGLGKSPSELLMNRQPRIRLSALRAKQSKNEVKIFQDNLDNQPKYSQNQAVFARNFGKGARWLPGVIVKIISPRNYDVKVGDVMWKRHEEQLRPRHIPSFENAEQAKSEMEQNLFPETKTETNKRETIPAHTEDRVPAVPSGVTNEFDTFTPVNTKSKDRDCGELTSKMDSLINVTPSESTRRYPLRERKPPKRFTE
ncbi:Retrovirus-related Pol poly from transposon [Paramuricea clavata]|uniref:RNA-directed DNA polymerase n=1 Tax=Paramuricea clavata TaxID=317549 RepID=A0A7D9IKE0_PARCT|nr:Retrovirus-related Pol poly from transposon [Paramuricea clavata]